MLAYLDRDLDSVKPNKFNNSSLVGAAANTNANNKDQLKLTSENIKEMSNKMTSFAVAESVNAPK